MRKPLITLLTSALVPMAFAAESNTEDQRIAVAGSQASIAGPEAWFTGHARIDPLYGANEHMNASGAYVTFEPGARSAWHIPRANIWSSPLAWDAPSNGASPSRRSSRATWSGAHRASSTGMAPRRTPP